MLAATLDVEFGQRYFDGLSVVIFVAFDFPIMPRKSENG